MNKKQNKIISNTLKIITFFIVAIIIMFLLTLVYSNISYYLGGNQLIGDTGVSWNWELFLLLSIGALITPFVYAYINTNLNQKNKK